MDRFKGVSRLARWSKVERRRSTDHAGLRTGANMSVAGTRRLCRVGLVAVLVTALCVLTLLDSPPQLPDPPADSPPTPGKQFSPLLRSFASSSARPLPFRYRWTVRSPYPLTRLCHLTMPIFSLFLSISFFIRLFHARRLDTADFVPFESLRGILVKFRVE